MIAQKKDEHQMAPHEVKALDDVADRLGALYQRVGRLQLRDPDISGILDEIVNLTEVVEAVSCRKLRERAVK